MKNLILLFILTTTILSVNAQETDSTTIRFDKQVHNFGEMKQLADGTCTFVFENTGSKPIIISNVRSSCGCTIPQKPKESIEIGNKGEIKVKYDTKRIGKFQKNITVYSNAIPSTIVLTITGTVKPN